MYYNEMKYLLILRKDNICNRHTSELSLIRETNLQSAKLMSDSVKL